MVRSIRWYTLWVGAALFCSATLLGGGNAAFGDEVDFNRDIRPILADRCFHCHGPDANTRKARLRLDEEEYAKARVIIPGDAEASELFRRIISADPNEQMPPPEGEKPALDAREQELIRKWIEAGAPWAEHWAFVPPAVVSPPETGTGWARNALDHFVAEKRDRAGLRPAPEADRATLLRRLSFDLTGLPPTPVELDAFIHDTSPDYYERAVARLLSSEAYGERMAMDWLDGARYADTNGYQNDFQRHMWPWRDWVIDSFNKNKPFDQFAIEQIAGDLLPNATSEQRIGTGFQRNNMSVTEGGAIEEEWLVENLVDRVSTTGTVFLGLTMGCARCHDHKYDPVSQREFFEFYAFFNSTADRGFYEETRGNTGPQVYLPNEEQAERLSALRAVITEQEQARASVQAAAEISFEAWWDALRDGARPEAPAPVFHLPLDGGLEVHRGETALPALLRGADTPQWQDGLLGAALYFDGADGQHVHLGSLGELELSVPFAISAWVKPEGPGAIASKMKAEDHHRGFDFLVSESGHLAVHLIRRWPENGLKVSTRDPIPMNAWTSVGMTWDGSGKAAGLKIYVGGYAVPLKVEKDELSISIKTDEPLRIGQRSVGEQYRGAIADFRFFNGVLGEAEMRAIVLDALAPLLEEPLPERQLAVLEQYRETEKTAQLSSAGFAVEQAHNAYNAFERELDSVMVLQEMAEPRPTYLLQRGVYDQPDTSEVLEPGVPAFLPELKADGRPTRLDLANWIVDPANPLTARVTVNRAWQRFFGTGLAPYADNFGIQSPSPEHLKLLDWLAHYFIDSGWDMKELQRLIVTSATYRQDSSIDSDAWQRDPENKLLARGPRYRMQAEMIRDNALASSGLLVDKIGGPSVMPYQPEGLWEELAGGAGQGPYEQATDEDLYRRTLYTYRKRTVPHPLTSTFDAPSWETCSVYRSRTNTPLQALALLNDLTYVEAARKLGERIMHEGGEVPETRLAYGFRLATGREPSPRELELLTAGFERVQGHFAEDTDGALAFLSEGESPYDASLDPNQLAAYGTMGSILLNLDETISKE